MKKVLVIISIFVVFIIIYILSANFFDWFTIAGIMPNLFIIFALFLGLFMGEVYGVTISAILGVILDLFMSQIIRSKWDNISYCRIFRGMADSIFFKG